MNSFISPHNATSLTGFIDLAAHSISLYGESVSKEPQHINDIFIPKNDISVAEPIEVQIDELGMILLLCISLLEILMTQQLVDWKAY